MFSVSERNIGETLVVCTALLLASKPITEGFESAHKIRTFSCVCCSRPKQAEEPRKVSCAPGEGSSVGCLKPIFRVQWFIKPGSNQNRT